MMEKASYSGKASLQNNTDTVTKKRSEIRSLMGNLFTWNDLIVIKHNAPPSYPLGAIVVVCGMEQVKSEKLANEFNIHIGDWLYTIEFGDGSSVDIPEAYLEKYIDTKNVDESTNC